MLEFLEILLRAIVNPFVAIGIIVGLVVASILSFVIYGQINPILFAGLVLLGGFIGLAFEYFVLDNK